MRNVVKNRFCGSLNGDWEMILKAGLGVTEKMRLANYCWPEAK
jgi:hypothetical protein